MSADEDESRLWFGVAAATLVLIAARLVVRGSKAVAPRFQAPMAL